MGPQRVKSANERVFFSRDCLKLFVMKGTGQGTSRGEFGEIRKPYQEPRLKKEIQQVDYRRGGGTVQTTGDFPRGPLVKALRS